jgi:predicted ATPase/class 3 adenylate cyclase
LLLTDIVDSTALAERLGDAAMAQVWAAHDRGARDLLPTWSGREIDKSDGMLLLFERVDDAVGFALSYHRMLSTLPAPLSARAGIHRAPILLRRNSAADVERGAKLVEVEGAGKAMAARIMSLANGGQTLLSEHARAGLQQAGLRVQSHGHWRMKGFGDPLELFEVGDEATSFVPPADAPKAYRVVRIEQEERWAPARDIRHSLPAERDSFFGRSATLLELGRRFDEGARLVTVLAMGGMGKTRLVERFGWSWLGDFPGGVWFCDLSVAASLDGIANAVAQGLGVPLANEQPMAQIGLAIAGRGRCLVILDNFEQVAQHAPATLGRWMAAAAQAQFLVTTRELLGLAGEETLVLPPLDAADAQRLFLKRAQAASPGFKPGAGDDAAIRRLAELLDALPLAIELAAARVNVMQPAALLARLSNRFALLASTARGRGRQATLRGVFDWSWELLEAPERAALAQLSVFESGFDLAAAEAVLQLGDDGPMVMDVLQSLVQKSFVRSIAPERFDLLVSVKEYAAQHLATAGRFPGSGPGMQRATEARHFLHFAAVRWRDAGKRPKADVDNFVAACRRASAHGDAPAASRALENAWEHIQLRGPFGAAVELASAVIQAPHLAAADRARVECVTGSAFAALGKNGDASRSFDAALRDARAAGDAESECRALAGLGLSNAHLGHSQASLECLASALAIATRMQDFTLEAEVRNSYATAQFFAGQPDASSGEFVAALELARRAGEDHLESRILANLGVVCIESGRMADARRYYEQALLAARSSGNRTLQATVMCNLGLVHHVQGSLTEALEVLSDALAELVDIGNRRVQGAALCNLGMVCERLARTREARRYLDEGLQVARELGDTRLEGQLLGYLGLLLAGNGDATAAREHLARADALLRSLADKTSLGIVLCARVEAEQAAGDGEAAVRALAEAEGFARELSLQDDSEFGVALLRARKAVGSAAQ